MSIWCVCVCARTCRVDQVCHSTVYMYKYDRVATEEREGNTRNSSATKILKSFDVVKKNPL